MIFMITFLAAEQGSKERSFFAHEKLKEAALINIFLLQTDQLIMCNVKGIAGRYKSAENLQN